MLSIKWCDVPSHPSPASRRLRGVGLFQCTALAVQFNSLFRSNANTHSIRLHRSHAPGHHSLREVRHQMNHLDAQQRRVVQLLNAYLADPCSFTLECYERALRKLHTLRGDENN